VNNVYICGNFGENYNLIGGQIVRTNTIFKYLKKKEYLNIDYTDISYIKKRNIMLLFEIIKKYRKSDCVILIPGSNSIKILLPLFILLKKIYGKKIYQVAIGGWLTEWILKKKISKEKLMLIDKIFVQTQGLKDSLNEIGITNTSILYNFRLEEYNKRFDMQETSNIINKEIKLIFCSRVVKEKGIEIAIEAVKKVIDKGYDIAFHFYGNVKDHYLKKLYTIISDYENNIEYMGVIEPEKVVSVMRNYDVMIFPTFHSGEGFPGTILEAYMAGIPVIASDWKYNSEFVNENSTGLLCNVNDSVDLKNKIIQLANNQKVLAKYKEKSQQEANKYSPDVVMDEFNKILEESS